MFNEQYYGLGETQTVYMTAKEAAASIEKFSEAEESKRAGLLQQEYVFKKATTLGRMEALQNEVIAIEKKLDAIKVQVDAKVAELESLGVAGIRDYIYMGVTAVASYFLPFVSVLSFFGVGSSAKKKKKRAEQLLREIDELLQQAKFWQGRIEKLNEEGFRLSTAFEQGPSAVETKLIGVPRKEETVVQAEMIDPRTYKLTKKYINEVVKDPYFQTGEELKGREKLPVAIGLPVGFQTIYSPALKGGPIVAKVSSTSEALKQTGTGIKPVYGGLLSGVETPFPWYIIPLFLMGGALLIYSPKIK